MKINLRYLPALHNFKEGRQAKNSTKQADCALNGRFDSVNRFYPLQNDACI
jgi:hypothetical protein